LAIHPEVPSMRVVLLCLLLLLLSTTTRAADPPNLVGLWGNETVLAKGVRDIIRQVTRPVADGGAALGR